MFDYWVSSRMEFSNEGKRTCFETAKLMINLAVRVRAGGLLALEDESHKDKFLAIAVKLIVGGVHDEETVRRTMQNWIIAGNYRGRALLKRILIMEGIVYILHGYSAKIISEELASYFGEDLLPEYLEHCGPYEQK